MKERKRKKKKGGKESKYKVSKSKSTWSSSRMSDISVIFKVNQIMIPCHIKQKPKTKNIKKIKKNNNKKITNKNK